MLARTSAFALALSVATWSAGSDAQASNCAGTSTGMIPLIDLGAGLYHGFPGGLYGTGSNVRPPAHDASGIAIANAIAPLDTLGNPDPAGRIVLISIGMSNATMEFSAFVPKANADPMKNPRVKVIDCAVGGQSADRIDTPSAAYWDSVATRLRGHGSSPLQAQVVWIKEADANPRGGFPAATDTLLRNLATVVRIMKDKLPNLKLAYLTSRIYAGYATSSLNPEPYAYESGFAVKWLIGAQIAGEDSLNWNPDRGPVEAPWLSWGPYLWADGLTARSDGLTWDCSEFVTTDGTHPSTTGRAKVADSLLTFFRRDATTEPWYANHTNAAPEARSGAIRLSVAPNPTRGALAVSYAVPVGERWKLEIVDLAGRRVAELGQGVGTGAAQTLRWNASDARVGKGSAPAGMYWVRLVNNGREIAKRMALLAP